MVRSRKKHLAVFCIAIVCAAALILLFPKSVGKGNGNTPLANILTDSITRIVSACPGEIGVAVIVNNADTAVVNNKSAYPMMSVFKVHQALALCNDFDNKGLSLDTLIKISRDELDPETWSPMVKDFPESAVSLTVRDLLRYTLIHSDNNASNLMFKRLVGVAQTDSFIATLIPRSSFRIACTEEEMSADHDKAYSNYTSPLGAAMLMNRLFTDSLVSDGKQGFIKTTLQECITGTDRISAPLLDKEGVAVAHKTGSGYVNEDGVLAAHNDVAYICLPNNVRYTLAVFVKDFKGNDPLSSLAAFGVTFIGGLFFSWIYVKWDFNLWCPAGLHFFMNMSWLLFTVEGNSVAAGGVVSNVFRILSVVVAIVLTNVYLRKRATADSV